MFEKNYTIIYSFKIKLISLFRLRLPRMFLYILLVLF